MLKFTSNDRHKRRRRRSAPLALAWWGAAGLLCAATVVGTSPVWADEVGGQDIEVSRADAPSDTAAEPAEDDGWHFEFAPYIWLIFVDGSTTFDYETSKISLNFDQILKQTHFAFFLEGEIRKGKFGFFSDLLYSYMWERTEEPPLTFSSKIHMVVFDFSFYYEALNMKLGSGPRAPRLRIQPFVGGRYVYVEVPTTVKPLPGPLPGQLKPTTNTAAPVLGLRAFLDIDEHWNMSLIGDGGGFSVDGMDVTWQAELLAGYRWHFAKVDLNLLVGYKGLGVDNTSDELDVDLILHGPVMKLGFEF